MCSSEPRLAMGYEKDIFAVFAYEFELSQYDLYSSSTPSSKTASNSSSPRPSMMSLKRSIAIAGEPLACGTHAATVPLLTDSVDIDVVVVGIEFFLVDRDALFRGADVDGVLLVFL